MKSKQSFISKLFTGPKSPEEAARHLVKLAIKPRTLAYSDFSTMIGAYLSNINRFRLTIASHMAVNTRNKKNLIVFSQIKSHS